MHYGHDDGGDDDVVDGDDGGVVGDDDDYGDDDGNRISFNLFSITPLLGVNGYSGHDDMEINFSIIRCQINMVVIVKMVLKMIIKIR